MNAPTLSPYLEQFHLLVAYLLPDEQPRYDSTSVWDTLVLEVVEALRGRRT